MTVRTTRREAAPAPSRFRGPTDIIDLKRLADETRGYFHLGLVLAVPFYAVIGSLFLSGGGDAVTSRHPTATLFVVNAPPAEPADVEPPRARFTAPERPVFQPRCPTVALDLKRPDTIPPPSLPLSLRREREAAYNTGTAFANDGGTAGVRDGGGGSARRHTTRRRGNHERAHRAMVVDGPFDRMEEPVSLAIPLAWATGIRPPDPLKRSVIGLVEALNTYTNIRAVPGRHLLLDSPRLLETPFLYLTTGSYAELTAAELDNLVRYLREGGFAFIDDATPGHALSPADNALMTTLLDVLGDEARFAPVPVGHRLYHCFFDFDDGPPPGGARSLREAGSREWASPPPEAKDRGRPVLAGLWLDGDLAAVAGTMGYGLRWAGAERDARSGVYDNDPQVKMGVNLVVYALTRENGMAMRGVAGMASARR